MSKNYFSPPSRYPFYRVSNHTFGLDIFLSRENSAFVEGVADEIQDTAKAAAICDILEKAGYKFGGYCSYGSSCSHSTTEKPEFLKVTSENLSEVLEYQHKFAAAKRILKGIFI